MWTLHNFPFSILNKLTVTTRFLWLGYETVLSFQTEVAFSSKLNVLLTYQICSKELAHPIGTNTHLGHIPHSLVYRICPANVFCKYSTTTVELRSLWRSIWCKLHSNPFSCSRDTLQRMDPEIFVCRLQFELRFSTCTLPICTGQRPISLYFNIVCGLHFKVLRSKSFGIASNTNKGTHACKPQKLCSVNICKLHLIFLSCQQTFQSSVADYLYERIGKSLLQT